MRIFDCTKIYLKCTAMILMFLPMKFLMFPTAIKCFVASGTALVSLHMAVGTYKLIRYYIPHFNLSSPQQFIKFVRKSRNLWYRHL